MSPVGLLTLRLHLAGCTSLKEKRSRIRPLLARLHREFNISAAEVDSLDHWQEAVIACAVASNDGAHARQVLESALSFVEAHFPEEQVMDHRIETL